ncbi:sensor domain-containing diguanylate cyclase [Sporolactobacillus laevolacticus]|uniref:Diguanylate cyclase n=1 Tax=Sporolactobacillus laevolacticus DSM 442 TaxID=1395513 RepID=V6IXP1_9BACL|nr:diguanylate cyclase [Sporolactobacillus laevolacticus]EST11446.1 diguanylate cyclase [Sporolactobacillus laevolacticus DSM 442]MDN3956093.1 diguanylate cyclase [Sporolactobacillus laevolacticus]
MDSILPGVLNCINEGLVIISVDLEITYWNPFMEKLSGKKSEAVLGQNVDKVLPTLERPFFHNAVQRLINGGNPVFFSAAMHRNLVSQDHRVNLKINRVTVEDKVSLLLEFIDVTNQFQRISQLRDYVSQLSHLNSQLKQKEKVIEKLAYYDKLTGVANRALFDKFADKYLNIAKARGTMLGLMFVDVNEFKLINDTYGHNTGDKVMTRVASLLTESTRKNDIVCRYGGDEFLVLLPDIRTFRDYQAIADRIEANKKRHIVQDGYDIWLSLSMGISFFPDDGQTIDELIAKADEFMYVNKHEIRQKNL